MQAEFNPEPSEPEECSHFGAPSQPPHSCYCYKGKCQLRDACVAKAGGEEVCIDKNNFEVIEVKEAEC
jgi:hypothetical protein